MEVEFLPVINLALEQFSCVLHRHSEELTKRTSHEVASHIDSLLSEMVSVVLVDSPESAQQEPVNHIPDKETFSTLAVLHRSHVGEHLLDQQVASILDTAFASRAGRGTALGDVVQGHVLGHDRSCFFQTRAEKSHHLRVSEIVHDPLDNVLIRDTPEGSEQDSNGDLRIDVWHRDNDLSLAA